MPDADIVGDDGEIDILSFRNDDDEAEALGLLVGSWIEKDGVSPSEIAVLVSKQQNLYCQTLTEAFERHGVPYREEDGQQDLASEPAACLFVDFFLVTCGLRQATAYRRLLDVVVFNQGLDEEREYQVRSRWDRFLNDTRIEITTGGFDFSHRQEIDRLGAALVASIGRDNIVALSTDYMHGDRLDQVIEATLSRIFELLRHGAEATVALGSFSGDRAVRIMSIHKSKGLEFESVIVLGVENETFWGSIEAERSAFFVGISRAKHRLTLTVSDYRKRPEGSSRWAQSRTPHQEFLSYAR